jgi:pimeloyl-ACP methyl ester carboxylesterase
MYRIEVNGTTLAYEDTGGDGAAVLFIHGLGGSANGWLAQLDACRERGWRGIAHDARGAGASAKPPGPHSVEQWAADAVALLDALGVARAALVGHSVGCMVAEHAAHALGERCWALAVCGGALAWPAEAEPVFAARAELARRGRMDEVAEAVATTGLSEQARAKDPRLLGLMRALIAGNDGEAYAESALATGRGSMIGPATLECPLLAFCGEADPVTPQASSEAIVKAAEPPGEFAIVSDAAHWCVLEDPQGTNRVLFEFLDRHRPG